MGRPAGLTGALVAGLLLACQVGRIEPLVTAGGGSPAPLSPTPGPIIAAPGGGDANGPSPAANPNAGTKPNAPESPAPTPAPGATRGSCTGRTWKVCDDFEATAVGGAPNPKLWQTFVQQPTSQVTVEDGRFFQGSRALHLSTKNSGYEQALLVNTSLFPAAQNSFYGRVFMYLDGDVPQAHFNLISGAGILPGQQATTTVNYGGQFGIFLANYYNAQDPAAVLDLWQHAGVSQNGSWTDATAIPSRRWACLEWQFTGPSNEMLMWLDGQAVPRMHLNGRSTDCCPTAVWAQPPFTSVSMGWTIVANQENFSRFDLWLDSVALDSSRIGCDL